MLEHLMIHFFGEAHVLVNFYMICVGIRLLLILITSKGALKKELLALFINITISTCLIMMCAVVDGLLPHLKMQWEWSVALIFTIFVILQEMITIVSKASQYVNVGILKEVLDGLVTVVQKKHTK